MLQLPLVANLAPTFLLELNPDLHELMLDFFSLRHLSCYSSQAKVEKTILQTNIQDNLSGCHAAKECLNECQLSRAATSSLDMQWWVSVSL